MSSLRKVAKKVLLLIAVRGEGGRGVKSRPLENFFFFFLNFFFEILLPFKNKNHFTLDNLSKYGHITLKSVGSYFYSFNKNYLIFQDESAFIPG